ncbi:hypothetical protein ACOM2C_04600 [Pseudarthrobacter sp. So.54]
MHDAHQEVAAAAGGVGKDGTPAQHRGEFDRRGGDKLHGRFRKGRIRVLPQPRPEPGGQKLFKGGRCVVGAVHQPVRERCRSSERRALGLQFRVKKHIIGVALVRGVQQLSCGQGSNPGSCHGLESQEGGEGSQGVPFDAAYRRYGYAGESGGVVHGIRVVAASGCIQPAGDLIGVEQFTAAIQRAGLGKRVS